MAHIGDKIKILHLCGEPMPINRSYYDKEGIIKYIDDIGQFHGTWGGLAIDPDVDEFIIVEDNTKQKQ